MSENETDETDEEAYEEAMSLIHQTTHVGILHEEEDPRFEGYWMFSVGMWDNHGIEDIEMRAVPASFINTAGDTIHQMNAYRLLNPSNPMLIGHRIQWSCGFFEVHESEKQSGTITVWNKDEMLRLMPEYEHDIGCACCDMRKAEIEP